MITIHVPMSTSNLGPGFDCLGLALKAFNTYRFEAHRKMELQGFPFELQNTSNVAYQVYIDCFRKNNRPLYPARITFTQGVPLCGGVGSSATAVIASIVAYHYFMNEPITNEELLLEATAYEHHPDNVAAAIYGSLTTSVMTTEGIMMRSLEVDLRWRAILLIPHMSLDTTLSRSVLPKTISLEDAVFNLSHALLIPQALKEGDETLLAAMVYDRWHEPYRLPLIPGALEILEYCRARAIPCFLSGAGASICVLTQRDILLSFDGWETRLYDISSQGMTYEK
ncbi:MAG: homoserine kinase [Bacilli bacterium]